MASELESDVQDTVDWGWKRLEKTGKTQLFCLTGLRTLVILIWKLIGLFLKKNHLLRCWDSFSSKLNWILYTASVTKITSKKTGALICSMKFLLLRLLFISTKYSCNVWAGAPGCYLDILDKLQKQIFRTVNPSLAASLDTLTHHQNIDSRCSSELADQVSLRYSNRLYGFSVTCSRCYKDVYINSFVTHTARLWNSLPIECQTLTYDLNSFKSSFFFWFFLNSFPISFSLFSSYSLTCISIPCSSCSPLNGVTPN